jgi:hypothetical protein
VRAYKHSALPRSLINEQFNLLLKMERTAAKTRQ